MSGLTDFRGYFSSFLGLVAGGVAATAMVLVSSLLGIAPPWPVAIVPVTAIAQLLALIFVYQKLDKAPRRTIDRRMAINLTAMIAAFAFYLFAHSVLVFAMPNGDMGVRGAVCSANALALYTTSCPFLETVQISNAEFEADRLWTPVGLAVSRVVLLAAWLGSFACLVNVIAAFVVYQRRRQTGTVRPL